jgi:hypothetical protein
MGSGFASCKISYLDAANPNRDVDSDVTAESAEADKADAKLLASFAQRSELDLWLPPR